MLRGLNQGTDATLQVISMGRAGWEGEGGSLGGAAFPRPTSPICRPGERRPETCAVYKRNGSCVGQIVLLKRARFVTLDVEQNFNIKRGNNLYVSEIYASLDGALPL